MRLHEVTITIPAVIEQTSTCVLSSLVVKHAAATARMLGQTLPPHEYYEAEAELRDTVDQLLIVAAEISRRFQP